VADHWVIHVDDAHDVRVDSFTLTELNQIATAQAVSWGALAFSPLRDAGAAQALFNLACSKVNVESRPLTALEATQVFELVEDDGLANEFVDGLPDPLPEATP
jgi:hypothetical protein